MKKSLIALAVLGATSSFAMATSNVTLYGVVNTGVLAENAKKTDTTVSLKSGFTAGSRWGIKGTEDLGNGYQVGFILEQGFNSDDGSEGAEGKQFNRESVLSVKGDFGSLAFGRTGALSFAQSQAILTGWAFGTSWGNGAWSSIGKSFSRMDNVISYATPKMGGFTVHAMYSNGLAGDTAKWSGNNHYYGLGVKFQEAAVKSSLIFEAVDGKGTETAAVTWGGFLGLDQDGMDKLGITGVTADEIKDAAEPAAEKQYVVNFGFEYNLGDWTPMFAYQYNWQDGGNKNHILGLSAKANVAGGNLMLATRYLFGKNDGAEAGAEDKQSVWTVHAGYSYPLSKRTALRAYAGYAKGDKLYDDSTSYGEKVNYNGWQAYFGMHHTF